MIMLRKNYHTAARCLFISGHPWLRMSADWMIMLLFCLWRRNFWLPLLLLIFSFPQLSYCFVCKKNLRSCSHFNTLCNVTFGCRLCIFHHLLSLQLMIPLGMCIDWRLKVFLPFFLEIFKIVSWTVHFSQTNKWTLSRLVTCCCTLMNLRLGLYVY